MSSENKPSTSEVLQKLKTDPRAFRYAVKIEAGGEPVSFGKVIEPWQEEQFLAMDPAWKAIVGIKTDVTIQGSWIERPRGHSKTSDIAVAVSWALFASKRRLRGIVAAADKDQAGFVRDAVQLLVMLNPVLLAALEVQATKIVNKKTGSELIVISSDAPSSYGATPDFCVCDEVTHWHDSSLWESLFSASAKKANCLVHCIMNAGFSQSWQWNQRELIRNDPSWYFSSLDGPKASWISPQALEKQRRLLSSIAYRRLWLNKWSEGSGDAIGEAEISLATSLSGPTLTREQGWQYFAAADLGVVRDASAVAVVAVNVGYWEEPVVEPENKRPRWVSAAIDLGLLEPYPIRQELTKTSEPIYHPGSGQIKLVNLKIWKPADGANGRVNVGEVEDALVDLHEMYGLDRIGCDPHQARFLVERLQKRNVPIELVDQTGPNLKGQCESLLSGFNDKTLKIYPDADLLQDLRNLRIVEKSYGVRLVSPKRLASEAGTNHGDTATALSMALLVARRNSGSAAPATIEGPLVCWP